MFLRKKYSTESEEINYWPGYVDALTNIVLNLVFMVAIFVIGITALEIIAARKPLTKSTSSTLNKNVSNNKEVKVHNLDDFQKYANAPEIIKINVTNIKDNDQNCTNIILLSNEEIDDGFRIVLGFEPKAIKFTYKNEKNLSSLFNKTLISNPTNLITISAYTSLDNVSASRLTMNRIIQIRQMILNLGVTRNQIEMKIFEGPMYELGSQKITVNIIKENK
jgi:hypothetical protein